MELLRPTIRNQLLATQRRAVPRFNATPNRALAGKHYHSQPPRPSRYSVLAAPTPSVVAEEATRYSGRFSAGKSSFRTAFGALAGTAVVGASAIGLFILAPNPGPAEPDTSSSLTSDAQSDPLDALLPSAFAGTLRHLEGHSNADLLRSWVTYLLCESPTLVNYGPDALDAFREVSEHVPVLGPLAWSIASWFMRQTLFHQYTGGETCDDCLPVLTSLHQEGIGVLFAYSVESRHGTSGPCRVSDRHMDAMRQAVATASTFGSTDSTAAGWSLKPTSVALKFSGLMTDPDVYRRASEALEASGKTPWEDVNGALFPAAEHGRPGLAVEDLRAMQQLRDQLADLCTMARDRGVRVVVDAEYSWFQPAIDRITQVLASRFNRPDSHTSSPTVYHTFQAYLRSTPSRLRACIEAADEEGFSTGVKLVRGAYLAGEPSYHRAQGRTGLPPTWSTKVETDACYDDLAAALVSRVAKDLKDVQHPAKREGSPELALMIAGHNASSVRKVIEQLRDQEGLAEDRGTCLAMADELRGRLTFGQILGMADNLTTALLHLLTTRRDEGFRAGEDAPFVLKYVPFGSVGEVMPYLGRRAQENSSILQDGSGRGGAKDERLAVGREIRRRIKALIA